MSRHYSPKTFLRLTPNTALKEFFETRGYPLEIDWNSLKEKDIDSIFEAIQALPSDEYKRIEQDFQDIDFMATEDGIKDIVEEGEYRGLELAEKLEPLENHHHKAMRVFLDFKEQVFDPASLFNHADGMSSRYWKNRNGLPSKELESTPDIEGLRRALSAYYTHKQGRGRHCSIDHYIRRLYQHYFFVYLDDYPEAIVGYGDDGQLSRQSIRRAFEIVFAYDTARGRLDLFAKGDRYLKGDLEEIFGRETLGEELGLESAVVTPYELNKLKSKREGLPTDPEDYITDCRIRRLRLSVIGAAKRRITFEANPSGPKDDVYEMLEQYLNHENLPLSLVNITQATIGMRIEPPDNGRAKQLTFDVSYPNSCNLKSKHSEQRLLGEKYLRRWGIDRT